MNINDLITIANKRNASDLHIEGGSPACLRIQGKISHLSEMISHEETESICKFLIGSKSWSEFLKNGSWDLSKVIEKTRCRINIFRSVKGLSMAIRLLVSKPVTIKNLNLHPDLGRIANFSNGLVLFSGATGSGKSTTMAALIEEINAKKPFNIITLEQPVEYLFSSKKSLIRQREVGKDTFSFTQGLKDALREDPDLIVVGEIRDQESMKLTLSAAETGHLVFATIHSASASEAINRIVCSFTSGEQEAIQAQLADSLNAVICQSLIHRSCVDLNVPICEILFTNDAVRSSIRSGNPAKIKDCIMTGSQDHMWTKDRYLKWIEGKSDWVNMETFRNYLPEDISGQHQPFKRLSENRVRTVKKSDKASSVNPGSSKTYSISDAESDPQLIIDDSDVDLGSLLDELS